MRKELYSEGNLPDLKAVIAINRTANQLNRRAAIIFRKHGLSMIQFSVLEVLYHKGKLTVGEIIDKILSTGGNVTVVLNNLAKDGFVSKEQNPSDHRVTVIKLTKVGEAKFQEVFPEYLHDLRQALSGVPESEKHLIKEILKSWKICNCSEPSSLT